MRIQHNIMAMNAYRNFNNNTSALSKNLEKLSSGYKINRAGDDAAGLAISEKMRAQISGLAQAQKNAKSGINLVQTAEGALTEVHDMLNRMVTLSEQSANGTYDDGVDRANLQKEFNQLRTEINRIADSSNFNGLNLLDGSLGLNTDAFSMSAASAVTASDGVIAGSELVKAGSATHLEVAGNATQANPKATIDLGDMTVTVADGDTAKFDFKVGDLTFEVEIANASGDEKTYTTTEVAAAVKEAIQEHATAGVQVSDGTHNATPTSNDGIRIGDAVYTVGGSGSTIDLTFAGFFTGATYTATADKAFSVAQADAFNSKLGFTVSAGAVTDGVAAGSVVHSATKVDYAKAKVDASKAGADIKLTADMIKQGNTLTIDGKIFTFQTESETPSGDNVIDVSAAKTDAERVHMAVDALSKQAQFNGQDSRAWKIGSVDGETIHIEQVTASASGKELKTLTDLQNVVSFQGQATAAKGLGTKITVDDAKVASGDVLSIDGKKYQFTNDATLAGTTSGDTTYVNITGGAASNLATAIGGSAEFNAADNSVTVRGAVDAEKAPEVLGKGLTLQIGDTSDSFNQMTISVSDMHAAALGIGADAVNIDTQTNAQAALQKIKDAINMVSSTRGDLGAMQNRLDHTINNLSVMTENIQDAEATIRDTDVAEEMMAYTKNNILIQSAQAMLAQANQVPQGVLQLLQ